SLSVNATTNNKTYDGTTAASGTIIVGSLAGAGAGESVNQTASLAFANKNVGTGKSVTASGLTIKDSSEADVTDNYTITYSASSADISKASLSVNATTNNKTYDGTTAASGTIIVGSLAGAGAGESVNQTASLAFANKNVGTGKSVTASGLTIKDSSEADVTDNYTITYSASSADISKASYSGSITGSKTYDGTIAFGSAVLSASVQGVTVNGVTETFALSDLSATTASKNAGSSKFNSVSATVSSDTYDVNNYNSLSVGNFTTNTATISARAISVSANNQTRTYGDANSTLSYSVARDGIGTSRGLVDGESLSGSLTTSATTKSNVGNYAITQGSLTNVNNANYAITYTAGSLAVVQRAINLTGSRAYDGSTLMSGSIFSLGNVLSGDALSLTGTGSVASSLPSTDAQVVSLGSLTLGSGNESTLASNYSLLGGTHTATITGVAASGALQSAVDAVQVLTVAPTVVQPKIAALVVAPVVTTTTVSNSVVDNSFTVGGLTFVTGKPSVEVASFSTAASSNSAVGVDAAGFMRVQVVGGGLRGPSTSNNQDNSPSN
ncbi:hypothetical protein B9Z39_15715, partial [Limnohabitans sp. JirII-29]|uniref:YDG domain-containing protein n=1 Tax=Limnohabitans sp. JirII-29 TaxID=1835756 RepID=UPI000DD1D411